MSLNITFQPPLSHERSVKFNMLQFMTHILAECPHLGIAIFNRNYANDLASSSRRISLLHVLDSQHRLKFVPLEIHIASKIAKLGPTRSLLLRSPEHLRAIRIHTWRH